MLEVLGGHGRPLVPSTDDGCHIQNGKQEIGAGVYCPLTDSNNIVEPNSAGIINTTCRAELEAIAAAITHSYSHNTSDSLTSLHQIYAIAKYQANQANNSVAGTGIPGAAKQEKENKLLAAPTPNPKITYPPIS
eukprot:1161780-Pelagomonas_calceolata.AAC.10